MTDVFSVEAAWAPYADHMSTDRVVAWLLRSAEVLQDAPEGVIPNLIVTPEGVSLASILLVTRLYLSEISVDGATFDAIDRRRVIHMRWWFFDAGFEREGTTVMYKNVRVELDHGSGRQTQVTYVGLDPDPWMKTVSELLRPMALTSGV